MHTPLPPPPQQFDRDELVQIDSKGNLIKAMSTEWERHEKIIKSLNLGIIDFRHGLMARDSLPHGVDSFHIIESLLKGCAFIDSNWSVTFFRKSADHQLTWKVLSAMSGIVMEECQLRESKKTHKADTSTAYESFDGIIMSCDELLDVETEVNKSFKKWGKQDPENKMHVNKWNTFWFCACGLSIMAMLIKFNEPWQIAMTIGISVSCFLMASRYSLIPIILNKLALGRPQKLSETDKFEFLKNAYVGTIQKLNSRLDIVKDRIDNQVRLHEEDREQITKYSDILDNTDEVIDKIEQAIFDLNTSKRRVSDKKGEVNRVLEEYIGENGHIAKKEAELERIKIAQELSDRMKSNFKTTMEITKNVDVLTDAIVPGLQKLMEFKIPQLIDDIEHKCDVKTSYLQVSQ